MAVLYSAREIVEAAVEKEKRRKAFYEAVTELSTSEKMRELFQFLTEEEERHVAAFTAIRDRIPAKAGPVEYSEDMDAYMDSVIDERLYSQIDSREFVQQAIDSDNVFRLAIGFEKDAILYFMEFLPYLEGPDKTIVEDLIAQEKGHIRKLVEVRNQLDKESD